MTTTESTNASPVAPRGVTGDHTTDGRPHGFTSLTPFIAVPNAAAALDFYRDVLGARVLGVTRMPLPDGTEAVVHAELDFGAGRLQLGEPNPEYGLVPPPAADDACYSLGLYVPDVDTVVARAAAAGGTVREEPQSFVSGDRYGSVRDPFGVRWSIMTRVEDLSDEESAARVEAWAAEQGGQDG